MISSKLNLWGLAQLWLAVLAVMFSVSGAARGQAVYGSIVGDVTDQSGAVVPGATVNVVSVETGQQFNEAADGSGRYNVVNLLPGHYNVRVTSKGFRTVEETGLNITPNTVARVDVHLEIGQTSEQVTVAADALHLQTENADTHTELTSKQVENIPLGGYRNYQTLINLVPGATPATTQNSIIDTPGRALRTNINGGNAQTNITRVDGAESINVWLPHHVGYVAPAETVDVVNVTTSAADADQGLAGASSITVVTKSGSNELHGSGFEFHNDQHLNARNFFLEGTKPLSIYNNYGGTIGGPILKNKLFYFFSFDGTNQKTAGNGLYTLPTADQRAGNFSAYLPTTVIYDPLTGQRDQYGNLDGVGRTPFANNVIPTNRISAIAQKIQSYYPAPNQGGTSNNYSATGGPILNRYNYDTKINWARNDKHTIWGKYGRMNAGTSGIGILGIAGGDAPGQDASPGTGDTVVQVATIGHTYTFSPNVVLDGNFGFNRMDQTVKGHDYGQNFGTILGIQGLNGPDIKQSGFPDLSIGGYESFGSPSWMPAFRHDETFTQSDNLTVTRGAHEFRMGFDLVRHHLNHYQPELSSGGARGAFDFNGNLTSINDGAYSPTQYNAYADFLLGASDNIQKGLQYILMTGREWQFGWYGQDRWQVSKNLTVNLGLRYEFYPLMTRCCGKGIERYDPNTNLVYLGGRGGVPNDVGITVSHKLFSPRAGVAYRLGDNTVIRTGYGLNFDPIPFSRPLRGFYPLTINSNFTQPNSYAPAGTLATGIPPVVGPDLSTGIVTLPGDASERSPWGGLIHRGYVQSWNFTIERKLPLSLVTSIGYVGQHSVHLLADRDINTGFPGSGTTLLPYNIAYGRTTATNMWDGYLSSSYNSLQASINRYPPDLPAVPRAAQPWLSILPPFLARRRIE